VGASQEPYLTNKASVKPEFVLATRDRDPTKHKFTTEAQRLSEITKKEQSLAESLHKQFYPCDEKQPLEFPTTRRSEIVSIKNQIKDY
jgi:hypothetical protein